MPSLRVVPTLRGLLQLNLLLSAGAGSIVAATAWLVSSSPSPVALAAACCGVFGIYNFDRLADASPAEGRSTPERRATVVRTRSVVRVLALVALLVVVVAGATGGLRVFVAALAFPLLGLAYVLPILPFSRARRLKDVPLLKSFYVPACWCVFAVLSVTACRAAWTPAAFCFVAFLYLRTYVSGYLGDIRDAADDAEAGVRTLAQVLGGSRSHRLIARLHAASALLVLLAIAIGWMPWAAVGLLLPAAFGYAVYRAYVRRPQRHEILFEIYDIELLGYAPSLLLAALLGAPLD
jgi:4-hydroxybenzoate polyprenyltransferase